MQLKKMATLCYIALMLSACGAESENIVADAEVAANELSPLPDEQIPIGTADSAEIQNDNVPANSTEKKDKTPVPISTPDWDKKIVKTADIELLVDNYPNYSKKLSAHIREAGGYIAQEQMEQTNYRTGNNLVIKIPTAGFTDFINSLQEPGSNMISKTIRTEDVTTEYIDTKARLQSKKEVREKYLVLLKQSSKIEDVLAVQSEINEIQESIESATARLNQLQHTSSFSTINLSCFQYENGYTGSGKNAAFSQKIVKAFHTGSTVLGNILLFIISIWPITLTGIALICWIKFGPVKKKG